MPITALVRAALAALLILAGGAAAQAASGTGAETGTEAGSETRLELVMVEEHGCIWCARWTAEVGPAYGKTPESAAAPLRRILIGEPLPADVSFARRAVFTPTFVLLRDGEEVGRIEGYPGPDFFWPLFEAMVRDELETATGGQINDNQTTDQEGEGS